MSDDKKSDPIFMWGLLAALIVGFFAFIWFMIGDRLASGTRWIRVGQLYLVSFFTDDYEPLRRQLIALPYGQITFNQFLQMNDLVLGIFRIPIVVIFMVLAWRAYNLDNKNPYTRKFNLEKLIAEHAESFPVTKPAVKFNALKDNFRTLGDPIPAKLPPFAEALSPEEWVSFNDIPITNGVPDRDAMRRAFLPQLGKRWQGALALPPYAQALFAVFAMKASGQRSESDNFLGELSNAWEPGKGLILSADIKTKIKDVLQDPKRGHMLEKIAAQHAFTTCAMLRCLDFARQQGGVLAPAQFLWLRAVDRVLWYPLNNLGRNAVHAEAAGAITHYRAERSANKPIPNPQVDPAADGILKHLKENNITTFPSKDFNKK